MLFLFYFLKRKKKCGVVLSRRKNRTFLRLWNSNRDRRKHNLIEKKLVRILSVASDAELTYLSHARHNQVFFFFEEGAQALGGEGAGEGEF